MSLDVIHHTATIKNDEHSLQKVLSTSPADCIELDFILSKDAELFWSHNLLLQYYSSAYFRKNNYLTLSDVLELNNHRKKLLLDIKYIANNITLLATIAKQLVFISDHDEILIESLDFRFLDYLLSRQYANVEIGLIINVLSKRFAISPKTVKKFSNLNFLSISSELWERNHSQYIIRSNVLYPNAKKYAWTWSRRAETPQRINNFIQLEADGIITDRPGLLL